MSYRIGECEGCKDHPIRLSEAGFCDWCMEELAKSEADRKASEKK